MDESLSRRSGGGGGHGFGVFLTLVGTIPLVMSFGPTMIAFTFDGSRLLGVGGKRCLVVFRARFILMGKKGIKHAKRGFGKLFFPIKNHRDKFFPSDGIEATRSDKG